MATSIGTLVLMLSVTATGGLFDFLKPRGEILNDRYPVPYGYGAGDPDGYGWADYGTALPLGANRTAEYYFPRYLAMPPNQLYFPTYYNAYTTRGQRFLPYAGCGGDHPAGGPARVVGNTPLHPYNDTLNTTPLRQTPRFDGRVEAPPINPGQTGLRP